MRLKLTLEDGHQICEVLDVLCQRRKRREAVVKLSFGKASITFITRSTIMATVTDSGGPLTMDITGFVDDAGNPVTDTDVPVFAGSDDSVATIAANPNNAQEGIITLTKKLTDPATAWVGTATFPAQAGGKSFVVTANLIVVAGAAASAQAVITGPGVIPGA